MKWCMHKNRPKIFYFCCFCLIGVSVAVMVEAREITDMMGRKVLVPDTIKNAYSSTPPATYMIYAIDPDLLIGPDLPSTENGREQVQKKLSNLPKTMRASGQGHTINVEVLLKTKPDVVVIWNWKQSVAVTNPQFDEIMKNAGIAVVYVDLDSISSYSDAFLFLGKLFKREERAAKLSKYGVDTLSGIRRIIDGIPSGKKPRVYYAEGVDGLSTECADSIHAELIGLAGGINVHQCRQKELVGLEKVSLEQVMLYDPEVILVQEKAFYDSVFKDTRWQCIKAVKAKQVYLIPRVPFNWFDRPPSFMRFLGLKWLANILHADIYRVDIVKETGEFYKLFLGTSMSDKDIRKILNL